MREFGAGVLEPRAQGNRVCGSSVRGDAQPLIGALDHGDNLSYLN